MLWVHFIYYFVYFRKTKRFDEMLNHLCRLSRQSLIYSIQRYSSTQPYDVYIYDSTRKSMEIFEPKYPGTIFWQNISNQSFLFFFLNLFSLIKKGIHVVQLFTINLTWDMLGKDEQISFLFSFVYLFVVRIFHLTFFVELFRIISVTIFSIV